MPTCPTSTSPGSASYVSLDARIRQGNGALRLWADVDDGQVAGGAVDLGLDKVEVSLDKGLPPLVLNAVTGRLAWRLSEETLEFSTTALQFDTTDGLRWPGGRQPVRCSTRRTRGRIARARRAARRPPRPGRAALIADRLPLEDATHRGSTPYCAARPRRARRPELHAGAPSRYCAGKGLRQLPAHRLAARRGG